MTAEKLQVSHSDETRIALLEQSINNINNTLLRFEKRFDKIDERFDKMDEKFSKIDQKFEMLSGKINAQLLWLLGTGATVALSVVGLMAKGFHWI